MSSRFAKRSEYPKNKLTKIGRDKMRADQVVIALIVIILIIILVVWLVNNSEDHSHKKNQKSHHKNKTHSFQVKGNRRSQKKRCD